MQPISEEGLRCMRCEREAEAVITLTNFVPYYIEKYGYCSEHTPETDNEYDALKQRIKCGNEKSEKTFVIHKTREEFIADFGNIDE
jgi:hypothetical protein